MSDRSELGDKCFWNPEWAEQEIERLTAPMKKCDLVENEVTGLHNTADLYEIERLQARVEVLEANLEHYEDTLCENVWLEGRVAALEGALQEIADSGVAINSNFNWVATLAKQALAATKQDKPDPFDDMVESGGLPEAQALADTEQEGET